MKNYGLRKTIEETEGGWREAVGFVIGCIGAGAGIMVIAIMIWLALWSFALPADLAIPADLTVNAPILPDHARTPGAINAAITQDNIGENICAGKKWSTKSIRPPQAYTSKLKRKQLAHGYASRNMKLYEEDHLISLELGGHPTDPRNLWPEVYAGPCGAHVKDNLENVLHELVCANRITLAEAQGEIASDWIRAYNIYIGKLVCQ